MSSQEIVEALVERVNAGLFPGGVSSGENDPALDGADALEELAILAFQAEEYREILQTARDFCARPEGVCLPISSPEPPKPTDTNK